MAQWFKAFVALVEDLSSILSTYMVARKMHDEIDCAAVPALGKLGQDSPQLTFILG